MLGFYFFFQLKKGFGEDPFTDVWSQFPWKIDELDAE